MSNSSHMACHDYYKRLSSVPNTQKVEAVTKEVSYRKTDDGRKFKQNINDKDYLAHGTGIPRRNAPAKTHIKDEDKIFQCEHAGLFSPIQLSSRAANEAEAVHLLDKTKINAYILLVS